MEKCLLVLVYHQSRNLRKESGLCRFTFIHPTCKDFVASLLSYPSHFSFLLDVRLQLHCLSGCTWHDCLNCKSVDSVCMIIVCNGKFALCNTVTSFSLMVQGNNVGSGSPILYADELIWESEFFPCGDGLLFVTGFRYSNWSIFLHFIVSCGGSWEGYQYGDM